ncbi:MAG: diguanylate cyclase [Clostridiaceae bacterium]
MIKNEEFYYKNLFKNNKEVMLLINSETSQIEDCNGASCDFYGYTYEEMLKMKISDFNTLSKDQIINEMNLAKEEKRSYFYFKHRLLNGQIRDVEVHSTPIKLDGRELLFSIITDTTNTKIYNEKLKWEKSILERTVAERTYELEKSKDMVFAILESSPDVIVFALDCNYKYIAFNKKHRDAMIKIWGKKIEIGMSFMDVIGNHEDHKKAKICFDRSLAGESFNMIEEYGDEKLSRLIWQDYWSPIFSNQGEIIGLTCFSLDVTEQKKAEFALKISEEKYRLLTENSSDAIWVLNLTTNKYTYISPSIFYLRGITAEEAMEETFEEAVTDESLMLINDAIVRNRKDFIENPKAGNHYIYEIQQPCKDGTVIWTEISTRYRYNAKGDIEVVGASRNIEKKKKSEKKVLYLSYHDQLTGLYNRRFYEEESIKINTKRNHPISLIMADVNGLKLTNDAFGHLAGDEILKEFSEVLKIGVREDDIIARTGGDEFVILLPETDAIEAEKIVIGIKEIVAKRKEKNNKYILSASFGFSTKHNINEDLENVYMDAENNMYREKLIESVNMKKETIKFIINRLYKSSEIEEKHAKRVSKLCIDIGKEMRLSEDLIEELGLLGLLHDIGKIGISSCVLNKGGRLNEIEFAEIKRHPEIGYQILRAANEYYNIAEYVLSHHEKIDGTGYPRNLTNNEIPIQSKILSIAEAYDIMTNNYSYKEKLTQNEAMQQLKSNSNSQFDEEIVKIFIEKVLGEKWE